MFGECRERMLEPGEGRTRDAGADLTDAGGPVRDAGVDGGRDAALDDAADVDPGRRTLELERRDGPFRIAPRRNFSHRARIGERILEAAGAAETDDCGRPRHAAGDKSYRFRGPQVDESRVGVGGA